MIISVRQVKAARALLGWSSTTLAEESGLNESTIWRLESPDDGELGGNDETRTKIRTALERAGVIFIEENGEGPGVRLKKSKRRSK